MHIFMVKMILNCWAYLSTEMEHNQLQMWAFQINPGGLICGPE